MNKESLIKGLLMIGGGYLVFLLIKGSKPLGTKSDTTDKKSADGDMPVVDKSQADLVMNAYSEALKNGESPSRLTELNKELMKEFEKRINNEKFPNSKKDAVKFQIVFIVN